MQAAQDMSDLKAVSMNLMHASLGVTDSVYAVLSDRDMQERIARLGKAAPGEQRDVEALLREALERLTQGRGG